MSEPNQKAKIRILCKHFYPEEDSTAQLLTDLAIGLSNEGYRVIAHPSCPSREGKHEPVDGMQEQVNGVSIHRIPATTFDRTHLPGRLVNWLTYCLSLLAYLSFRNENDQDVLLTCTVPPFLIHAGSMLGLSQNRRHIPIIYDTYPEILVRLDVLAPDSFIVKTWTYLNNLAYREADRIVVLDQNMNELLQSNYPSLDDDDLRIIHNWQDPDDIRPMTKQDNPFAREHGYDKQLTLLYSGHMGPQHDLGMFMDAADELRDEPVRFVFIGDGPQKTRLRDRAEALDLDNVDFHPFQPEEKLPQTLTCADVSILSEAENVVGTCVTCKIYSSLASGQALLGVAAERSEITRVIREAKCGRCIRHGDCEELIEVIHSFLHQQEHVREMGMRARQYLEEHFTLQHAVRKYHTLLEETIGKRDTVDSPSEQKKVVR